MRSADPVTTKELHCYQTMSISNDLYGSDTVYAFELAIGFTKPVETDTIPRLLPADVRSTHD